jgi:hypothetical protein
MNTIKFITKLATVWLIGFFVEALITAGQVFAYPMSEWGVIPWFLQICYMIALVGISLWWHEEESLN